MSDATSDDEELAQQLLDAWDEGRGTPKSELERQVWGDGSSHGRRFDRFVRKHLGVSTRKPSKQTDRIADLERQVRGLGAHPVGAEPPLWEVQLQHARESCVAALRVWNDPIGCFRTAGFSLLFVTAWNSLAIALVERAGGEWRKLNPDGSPVIVNGAEQAMDTVPLISGAFPDGTHNGLRENVRFWVDLRNAVAHRHLPALDASVVPFAQAGLLNFETALADQFGPEFALAGTLSVPLQLSGFRDPSVLASRRKLLAALPLDVQAVLSRADTDAPELLEDETFMMRVAFVPYVPSSSNSPDVVALFAKPGDVPSEVTDTVERYLILPKSMRGPRPNLGAKHVVAEVSRRIPYKFNAVDHAAVGRFLGVRPPKGEEDRSLNEHFCDYVTAGKIYVYNQRWIDKVVEQLSTEEGFREATGREPVLAAVTAPDGDHSD